MAKSIDERGAALVRQALKRVTEDTEALDTELPDPNGDTDESDSVQGTLEEIAQFTAPQMENLLFGLVGIFAEGQEQLTNMDATNIILHLRAAAKLVQARSGN